MYMCIVFISVFTVSILSWFHHLVSLSLFITVSGEWHMTCWCAVKKPSVSGRFQCPSAI